MGLNDGEGVKNQQTGATWAHESLAQVRIKVLRGHDDAVTSCQFCFNDERIVAGSKDKTIRIWDVSSGEQLHIYKGHTSYVSSCRADPYNARIASGSWDKRLCVWDIPSGKILWEALHGGVVTTCDFSHDGKYIVTGCDLENAVIIWDARDGQQIKKLPIHKSTVTCCRFSPSQHRICSTSMDKTTKIIDMMTFTEDYRTTLQLGGHINIISSCAFSQDEHLIATGSWDKNILLWDVATGVYRKQGPIRLGKGHEGSISSCEFSPDGSMLVSASYDETLIIWDVDNGCQKFALKGHGGWVNDCGFSKDQKWVLSCSNVSHFARILEHWGSRTLEPNSGVWRVSLKQPEDNPEDIVHIPSLDSTDKTIRLWCIESSDDIPVVLEHRKNIGLRIVQCNNCSKPFSIAQLENESENSKLCVFCRLEMQNSHFSSSHSLEY